MRIASLFCALVQCGTSGKTSALPESRPGAAISSLSIPGPGPGSLPASGGGGPASAAEENGDAAHNGAAPAGLPPLLVGDGDGTGAQPPLLTADPEYEPPPEGEEPPPLPIDVPHFQGQRDDDILQRICNLPVRAFKPLGGGASISLRVFFEGGERAALKPQQRRVTRYQAEVAAYRVSRALRLSAVSPSCVRRFPRAQLMAGMPKALQDRMDREMIDDGHGMVPCAVLHWIVELHSLRLEKQYWWRPLLRRDTPLPPEQRRRVLEISTEVLLDFLIVNDDRWSGGNTHESGDRMVYLDQGAGFGNDPRGTKRRKLWNQLSYCQRFDRTVAESLRNLDLPALKNDLRGLLGDEELKEFGERVKQAQDYLEKLHREAPDDSWL